MKSNGFEYLGRIARVEMAAGGPVRVGEIRAYSEAPVVLVCPASGPRFWAKLERCDFLATEQSEADQALLAGLLGVA